MKKQIINYTFDKTAKTVTFTDYVTIRLDSVLVITNVTSNIIIYNFASSTLGGTVATNVLTLTYNTSSMNNTDKLQIWYWDSDVDPATQTTVATLVTTTDFDAKIGSLTEAAPATDTASSGLNGRLQRIAQRITSLIAQIPATLGQKTMANSLAVVVASDQSAVAVSSNAATPPSATTMQAAATGSGNGTNLPVTGHAVAILNVVSSVAMSGGTTVNFEASVDDTTWVSITASQIGVTGNLVTSTTADGDFRLSVAGYKSVRARISAYSAGTVTVKGYPTPIAGPTHAVSVDTGSGAGATIGTTSGAAVITDATGTLQQYLRGLVSFFANVYNATTNFLLVRNLQKDVYANAAAFTITLNSLASSTAGVGRQSTLLTSNTNRAAIVNVKLKMGTTPTANAVCYVYLLMGDGTIATDSAGASDAGLTVANAKLLGVLTCISATAGLILADAFDTRLVTPALGPQWGIAIVNASGAALDASAGGTIDYTLVS
jgi:hypothetical protein